MYFNNKYKGSRTIDPNPNRNPNPIPNWEAIVGTPNISIEHYIEGVIR